MTAHEILAELTTVAMAPWQESITIRRDRKTDEVISVTMDLPSKIRALELLGKYHGLFTERQEWKIAVRQYNVGRPQCTLDQVFPATSEPVA
ncbi:MAG: hypothetical protein AB7V46_24305 [Thermomicrobiales bacterium]